MQIDLANTLVHKAYFVYYALFIITRKLRLPSFGGVGGGSLPSLFGRGWGWAFEKGLECVSDGLTGRLLNR